MATFTFLSNLRKKVTFDAAKIWYTHRDVVVYDGETSRDDLFAAQLGNSHKTVTEQQPSKGAQTAPEPALAQLDFTNAGTTDSVITSNFPVAGKSSFGGVGVPVTTLGDQPPSGFPTMPVLDGAVTSYVPAVVDDALMEGSDSAEHVKPRDRWKLRTLVEFWSAATVGWAQVVQGTTVSGSAEVTVPNVGTLCVGQGVSGTGIASGSIIVAIPRRTQVTDTATPEALLGTKIILSQPATASGTVALTFSGSDLVAKCWLDSLDLVTNGAVSQLY